jgi:hypothetical protein
MTPARDLECLDRVYLNAYVPKLQVSGPVVTFFSQHRNQPIASPALIQRMGEGFSSGGRQLRQAAPDPSYPVCQT